MPTAWLLYETLRVACFPVGVRLERVRERRQKAEGKTLNSKRFRSFGFYI
ncbi:MAG: hypothetical protein RMX96_09135 [Nostoc sp. ChiSLP02]|nr:hypothetical protein [Nostoc sp. DedSLP05]MDZ8101722.1 hypothetical protein [Nostoc sp. DedSLP01]MDZ8185004.1 hypothetical protein [Nostoc sp. ChiSLP02]